MEWHAVISNIHTWCLSVKWPVTNERFKQTSIIGRSPVDHSIGWPESLPRHGEGIMERPAYSKLISNHIISNIFLLQRTRQENKRSRLNGKSWEQLQHRTTLQPIQYLCLWGYASTHSTLTRIVTCVAHTAFTLHFNHSAYNGAP